MLSSIQIFLAIPLQDMGIYAQKFLVSEVRVDFEFEPNWIKSNKVFSGYIPALSGVCVGVFFIQTHVT